MVAPADSREVEQALEALRMFGPIFSVKLYRLKLDPPSAVPVIPCLDHEAMLHQHVDPHAATYLQERTSGDLHEVVFIPAKRQIQVDTFSTWGESSPQSHTRLLAWLATSFPTYRIAVTHPAWWRNERRVAEACRAQVSLRDVLLGEDMNAVKAGIDRLQMIGTLMEKHSRVASWSVRTLTGPILTVVAVIAFLVLGTLTPRLGEAGVTALRYAFVGMLGAWFLYYGLKAVQLTGIANRVWKRAAEYSLILAERRRLSQNT